MGRSLILCSDTVRPQYRHGRPGTFREQWAVRNRGIPLSLSQGALGGGAADRSSGPD